MYDYLIVGSGLFGSVFAHQARQKGQKVLMIEKRDHVGGNCFCKMIEGISVHYYGPHIFHTSKREVWDFVNQFVSFNKFVNSPIANYQGKIYNLPFNMNTFHQLWGVVSPEEAMKKLEEQKTIQCESDPQNLEDQAISLVGTDIYEKLIKGYTEKQWGRSCRDLPGFIIKRLPVRYKYDNNYYNDEFQGIPVGGYNKLVNNLLDGVEVELITDFIQHRVKYEKLAKRILYTGPIDQFYGYKCGKLQYRSLSFKHKVMDVKNYQGNAVVNFTDKDIPYTRIIEHKHFDFCQSEKTVISYEYPEEWMPGAEPFYPVNDNLNNGLIKEYKKLAKKETNIIFGGRLADYCYYDMDQVIANALLLSKTELNLTG